MASVISVSVSQNYGLTLLSLQAQKVRQCTPNWPALVAAGEVCILSVEIEHIKQRAHLSGSDEAKKGYLAGCLFAHRLAIEWPSSSCVRKTRRIT